MKTTLAKIDENKVLLVAFSITIAISTVLILSRLFGFIPVTQYSETIEFQLTLTPEHIIVKKSCSNMVNPYTIESGSIIRGDLFPLRLPKIVRIQNKTINIKTWSIKVRNILLLKGIEADWNKIVQKANIVDLNIYLKEENSEAEASDLSFKLSFESNEAYHEANSDEAFSESLKPLAGSLYGCFYPSSKPEIKMVIAWEPSNKPLIIMLYHENGEVQYYLLENGEWEGSFEVAKGGLNYLVIGNPDQTKEIKYTIIISYLNSAT